MKYLPPLLFSVGFGLLCYVISHTIIVGAAVFCIMAAVTLSDLKGME